MFFLSDYAAVILKQSKLIHSRKEFDIKHHRNRWRYAYSICFQRVYQEEEFYKYVLYLLSKSISGRRIL